MYELLQHHTLTYTFRHGRLVELPRLTGELARRVDQTLVMNM